MRTCNHTEYLFRFWGKYLLDQSSWKKTGTHQQNSGNVQEHEKFPLELFPTCCLHEGRVCWSGSPTRLVFWERNMLSLRNEAWLSSPTLPSSVLVYVCVCVCFSFLYPPAFSRSFPFLTPFHKGFPAESSWCPVLAAFPRLSGHSQEINGCLFSPVLWFYVGTDTASTLHRSILQGYFHSDVPLYK